MVKALEFFTENDIMVLTNLSNAYYRMHNSISSVTLLIKVHTQIDGLRSRGRYMGKHFTVNSKGQYLDGVVNIGVNLTSCIFVRYMFLKNYPFSRLHVHHLPQGG